MIGIRIGVILINILSFILVVAHCSPKYMTDGSLPEMDLRKELKLDTCAKP